MDTQDQTYIRAVGARIRQLRLERGLSSTELAARIGLASPAHLLRIERGDVEARISTVHAIARALEVDALALLDDVAQKLLEAAHA